MALYLVRHAKAGSRSNWQGDDRARPLSNSGWRQAEAIAKRLKRERPTRLVSSPYVRCVQTLEPLGRRTGLEVAIDERLAEAGDFESALDLLDESPDGTVLCSHGDIIPAVMQALHRRGIELTTDPDWRKGTVWVLQREGDLFATAECWPPPDVRA
jgi:8-oxo-dGTP diphosphatase